MVDMDKKYCFDNTTSGFNYNNKNMNIKFLLNNEIFVRDAICSITVQN